ncbi:PREDICTED: fasciclin-like arabinogalactan protein 4 [Ipomoea nil]|uniref:fasciclin-like arabinogalactan protein 4 n=1 Tax=Ipomoea nil TaxID=35883 RepID=UPI000901DDB4|nr:PREDICTED: fasciclin-like arabinogalactan protein 4 [Ipomoea nil]
MAATISMPHFAPLTFLFFLLLSTFQTPLAIDITTLLSSYPNLTDFTNLLATTNVAVDLSSRTSLTLLAVPNAFLHSSDLTSPHHPPSPTNIGDVLRYHVLLEYLSWPELRRIPPAGKLVTTLFQTTGRASSNFGSVNITRDPVSGAVTVHSPVSNATVVSLLRNVPYNISIFSVNSLLVPYGIDLMASETRPPLGLNITKTLIDDHGFNVAAAMLAASGVEEEFEKDEGGAGITLFVPTDEAFADLPPSLRFQSLPADKKAVVLRFHVLHSYYPLGSLESIVNPLQPTLATEQNGAGSFTLNISRINGSVSIETGIVQALVTQTAFDQNPVAIFGISHVLLPKEFFGKKPIEGDKPGNGGIPSGGVAQPPDISLSPENSPGLYGPSSHLSSPPGIRQDLSSLGTKNIVARIFLTVWCIGFHFLVCHLQLFSPLKL